MCRFLDKGKRASLFRKQGSKLYESKCNQLNIRLYASIQTYISLLPFQHDIISSCCLLKKTCRKRLMITATYCPHGCFLIGFLTGFSWSRKRMAECHAGEVIQKGRWKLAYERALWIGSRDEEHPFDSFSIMNINKRKTKNPKLQLQLHSLNQQSTYKQVL